MTNICDHDATFKNVLAELSCKSTFDRQFWGRLWFRFGIAATQKEFQVVAIVDRKAMPETLVECREYREQSSENARLFRLTPPLHFDEISV